MNPTFSTLVDVGELLIQANAILQPFTRPLWQQRVIQLKDKPVVITSR